MGIFICFTGIDGSGKTTLAKALVTTMEKRGVKAIYVYNRYIPLILRPAIVVGNILYLRNKDFKKDYVEYSEKKRKVTKKHPHLAKLYRQFLMFDYYFQILLKIKIPLLLGNNIICDRYIYDTIVTDIAIDFNYSKEEAKKYLDKILSLFPAPDILFLVDLPEEIAYKRKDDLPSIEYLTDRRGIYQHMGEECNMIVLDGSKKLDALKCEVEREVFRWIKR